MTDRHCGKHRYTKPLHTVGLFFPAVPSALPAFYSSLSPEGFAVYARTPGLLPMYVPHSSHTPSVAVVGLWEAFMQPYHQPTVTPTQPEDCQKTVT